MDFDWLFTHADSIFSLAVQHANLSWPPVVLSLVAAVPLGWLAHRFPRARGGIVGAAGLLYAIPSLALFVVLPLIIGTSVLSKLNVIVAMTLYGIALLVRFAADGFDSVDEAVKSSAVAVGYPAVKRVCSVELPLAGPVILAGLRVVSASTISLVSVGALVGVKSLGTLFTEGFARSFPTQIIAGVAGTVVLAVLFDLLLVAAGRLLMPWSRAGKTGERGTASNRRGRKTGGRFVAAVSSWLSPVRKIGAEK